jgi:hypothetical protein
MSNVFGLPTRTSEHDELELTKTPSLTQKKILIAKRSEEVINKIITIALNDDHPKQDVFLKFLGERALPMAEFEKKKDGSRTAITITIGGLNDVVVEGKSDDVEEI